MYKKASDEGGLVGLPQKYQSISLNIYSHFFISERVMSAKVRKMLKEEFEGDVHCGIYSHSNIWIEHCRSRVERQHSSCDYLFYRKQTTLNGPR